MQHTGTLFLGKTKPVAETTDGEFRLTLSLIDNLGNNQKEGYRVRWTGQPAATFWSAHQRDLVPGAPVRVELTHLRAHAGATYPPIPELRARVVKAEIAPRRSPSQAAPSVPQATTA